MSFAELDVELEVSEHHTEVKLKGDLTIFSIETVKDKLCGLLDFADVRLDLAALQELDSCGAQMLWLMQNEARRRGVRLGLSRSSPVADEVLALLGITLATVNKEERHGSE